MDLVHMRTFAAVIEERGITAAARRLGCAKSVCSRRLSELEADLGAQLVRRTTRSVTPTDLGMDYFDQCRDILQRVDRAAALVTEAASEVSGPLRVTAPLAFTGPRFQPMLEAFITRYEKVRLHMHFSDAREDLFASGFDAGIRIGELADSALISKKVGECRLLVCASPGYLAAHGTPSHPDELNQHQCLMYTNLSSGSIWTFDSAGGDKAGDTGGGKIRKRLSAHVKSNNGGFLCDLAEAGDGIVRLPDFIVQNAIDAGRLELLFAGFAGASHGLHVIYPERRNLGATVRAFIDHITENLAADQTAADNSSGR